MKFVNIIQGIFFVFLFLLLINIIPKSKKISGGVNYAPNGFIETIKAGINDSVMNTEQKGLYWVTFNNGQKFPFSFDEYKMNNKLTGYPSRFISIGDSIYKKNNNDTFYLIRNDQKWFYILPCCP